MLSAYLVALLAATPSAGKRVGLFVGSNAAPAGLETLRHAETDARRLRDAFVEVGGMAAADAMLLASPTPAALRGALSAIRARAEGAEILLFYYSGHADDRALLLGEASFAFSELEAALADGPAALDLHLVDACRAGALTRRKGATLGAPFSVRAEPRGEGRVVIASSAEWEDSQESDRIGGSFFTLHFATALRGAADRNGDGAVSLEEAYRYVYGRTVESTLPSRIGPQHPTYRYDLRGRGDLILSWPTVASATLSLDPRFDYLVLDERAGYVVAELRGAAELRLHPGRYRVSRRGEDGVYEGIVELGDGGRIAADPALTRRVELAALAKGGARVGHAVFLEAGVRSAIGAGFELSPMLRASYGLDLGILELRPRIALSGSFGGEAFRTPRLRYEGREIAAGLEIGRSVEIGGRIGGGIAVDAVWLSQRELEGREPSRDTLGFAAALALTVESPSVYGLSLLARGEGVAYSYRFSAADREPTGEGALESTLGYRAFLALGYRP